MAKITFKGFPDPKEKKTLTPLDVVQGKNLKPAFGIIASNQPTDLVDDNGDIIQKSIQLKKNTPE